MFFIEFAFAFVSLIIMCCAFNERITRDRATEQTTEETIIFTEQQFHALVARINTLMTFGRFGAARNTCVTAFETLISLKLDRKTVATAQLSTDLQNLDLYVHQLDYEREVLPLYRKLKESLKTALGDKHVLTSHAKKQVKYLHNLAEKVPKQPWFEVLAGRNVQEFLPMLLGEMMYEQFVLMGLWSKEMCSLPGP